MVVGGTVWQQASGPAESAPSAAAFVGASMAAAVATTAAAAEPGILFIVTYICLQ